MPTNNLWAGVLSQLLIHQESGCPHAARHAIRLLDQLCDFAELDPDVRALCERASQRLGQYLPLRSENREMHKNRQEANHAGAA